MNLFSGCLAIYFSLAKGDLETASWMIVIAGVFDLFDGLIARLLGAQSNIGADLDSLSDVVSFGVAPSFLLFQYIMMRGGESCFFWALPSFVIALFAAYRLAKFNNDTRQTTSFIGLPVPACALFWIGIVSILPSLSDYLTTVTLVIPIYFLLLLTGWAMVAEIPLLSFKIHFPIASREDRRKAFLGLFLVLLGIIFGRLWGWGGVSAVILCYFIGSMVMRDKQDR